MSFTFTQAVYTEVSPGHFQPINARPAGIKCLTCDREYSSATFQDHIATHINPQYMKPVTSQNPSTKPSLFSYNSEATQQIDIKSCLPQQLPQSDHKLRDTRIPTGQKLKLSSELPFFSIPVPISQPADQNPSVGEISTDIEQKQVEEMLEYNKKIKLEKKHEQIIKKQIHMYRNEKMVETLIDKGGSPKKLKKKLSSDQENYDETGESDISYEMHQTKYSEGEEGEMTKFKSTGATYMIETKHITPKKHLHFNTLPRNVVHMESQQNESTVHEYDGPQNHRCPCCGGFYCSVCNSDIPPIYRPVPDKDGNYHFYEGKGRVSDKETLQWYKQHYFKKDIHICKSCNGVEYKNNRD